MSRMIDADAFCEWFKEYGQEYIRGEKKISLMYIWKHVQEMPAITTEPHWIPCSERLPEEGREVLGTDLKNDSIITDVVLATTECIKKFVSTMQPADVQPVVQWIPCSERLPEEKINPNTQDYDWVLCSTTFGDVRAYNFGRGRFLHGCGDVTQYVIAWMPLPEGYRGEQDE